MIFSLENLDNLLSNLQRKRNSAIDGQIDFFNSGERQEIHFKKFDNFDKKTLQMQEKEVIGFYLSAHPLSEYKDLSLKSGFDNIYNILSDDKKYIDNRRVKVLTFIENIKKKTTKNNDTMAFLEISDTTGSCELIVFPKTFIKFSHTFTLEKPLVVTGRVSIKDEADKQIICERIEFIDNYANSKSLYIKAETVNSDKLKKAISVINHYKGTSPILIYCNDTKKLLKSDKYSCNINNELIDKLKDILGENNIAVK